MKKRIAYAIIAVIAVFVLMSLTVISASAEVVDSGTCGENLTWTLDGGTLTISGTGEMYDYNLTDSPWESSIDDIRSLVVEDGVTSIGKYAFLGAYLLTKVSLADSIESIGDAAFKFCGFKEIDLPEGLIYMGDSCFDNGKLTGSITIPPYVQTLNNYMFFACKITDFNVSPESQYFCSENGVVYSKDMTELVIYPAYKTQTEFSIPEQVRTIGNNAFYCNDSIVSIVIPDNTEIIKESAFANCNALESVTLGKNLTEIGNNAFSGDEMLKKINLPENLLSIGETAFRLCSGLKEINLPASLKEIGSFAFKNCTGFSTVYIPAGVETIGHGVFATATGLTEIIVDENNTSYYSEAGVVYFKKAPWLVAYPAAKSDASFTVPENITSIYSDAFNGALYLKHIDLPDGMTKVPASAFSECGSLESVSLSSGVTQIADFAFYNCSSLTSIELPEGLTRIDICAFCGCTSLEYINIPSTTEEIKSQAFEGCTSLTAVVIPESVNKIGSSAFNKCPLSSAVILNNDCTIENSKSFPEITIIKGYENSTAKTFAEEYGYKFSVITASGTFGDGFTWILDGNGVLQISGQGAMPDFTSTSQPWGEYKDSISFASVGNTVTNIGAFAFYDYASLEGMKLEDCTELKKIGNSTFNGCTALENISIPAGVSEIGSFAFVRCTSLESIDVAAENEVFSSENGVLYNISEGEKELTVYPAGKKDKTFSVPDDVTSIGQNAFAYCEYITSIKFSNSSSLRSIRQAAFYRCSALKSFRVPGNVEVIENNVFVMCEKLSAITADAKNKYFANIGGVLFDKSGETLLIYPAGMREEEYVVPASVKTLAYESFCYCLNLKAVTFEEGSKLSVIKDSAFYNCEELTYLALPDSLHTIEKYAFLDCVKLPFIYIPENVKEIGSYAFLGCQSLKNVVILSRDCRAGYINDSLLPVTFYVYRGSAVIPDLFAQGTIKYIVEADDVYSYEDAVLTVRDLSSVPAGEEPYCYPWTRYMYEAECIIFDNSGTVGANLFSGFSECTVIIINNDGEDEAGTAVFSDGAFSGFSSLKTIVSFSDILITENAFDGGISPTVFCEAERSSRSPFTASVFSYSEGTVSFSEAELSFTDYDFFDLLIAICHIYGDKIVDALYFPYIETVGFAFDDDYMINNNGILYDKYADVKIAPMVSYDGLTFERISFNEFCSLAANEDVVLLKMVILDETEPDDEPDGVFVSFSEIMVQVFRTIATLFNKILKALFGLK